MKPQNFRVPAPQRTGTSPGTRVKPQNFRVPTAQRTRTSPGTRVEPQNFRVPTAPRARTSPGTRPQDYAKKSGFDFPSPQKHFTPERGRGRGVGRGTKCKGRIKNFL